MCHLVGDDALVESVEGAGDDELASLSRGPGVLHFGDVAEFDVWYLGAKRSPPWLSYVVGEEALGVFEAYAGCEVCDAGCGFGGVIELVRLAYPAHVLAMASRAALRSALVIRSLRRISDAVAGFVTCLFFMGYEKRAA